MVRQINPSLARLWINNTRHFGYPNPYAVTTETPASQLALEYLEAGLSNNQFAILPKLVGGTDQKIGDLVGRLSSILVTTSSFLPELEQAEVERRFSEILRLFAIGSTDPAEALRKRSAARVFVSKLDRTGMVLLEALSAAGIGLVFTQDSQRVGPSDTLNLGHPESSLGKTRISSAREVLGAGTKTQLHSRVSGVFDLTDVAIILGTDVVNPIEYQTWMARDVPHLAITFDESGVEISQLVIPGLTPCLSCLNLERLAADPNWSAIAPQLSLVDRDLSDSASLLFATGVALTSVLTQIDLGNWQEQANRIVRLDRKTGAVLTRQVGNPTCGCSLTT
ncbi:MAG: hypothetical protein K9G13_06110 [Aquiluna sp.]|nr:hypothetical protein [Aquiluna sp.]MCF8546092.1 hypothetical protein [Aquiluna sp.]